MQPSRVLYNVHTHTHAVVFHGLPCLFTLHSTIPLFFSPFVFLMSPCVVLSSGRSAAPDLHRLNEDGELWLVNQGLKETIRCNLKCVNNNAGVLLTPLLPPCICLPVVFCRGCLFIYVLIGGVHQTSKALLLCSVFHLRRVFHTLVFSRCVSPGLCEFKTDPVFCTLNLFFFKYYF